MMAPRGHFFSDQSLQKTFLLVLALSWGIWLLLAPHGLGRASLLALPLLTVASASPALLALLASATGGKRPRPRPGLALPAAFVASWLFFLTITVVTTLLLSGQDVPQNRLYLVLLLCVCGVQAAVPAGIVAAGFTPYRRARDLLASVLHPRKRLFGWYLLAALLIPAAGMLSLLLTRLLRAGPVPFPAGLSAAAIGLYFLNGLVYTTLGVEVGWRAFALPRLQRVLSPLGATILLAGCFLLWQLPLYLVPLATAAGAGAPLDLGLLLLYGVDVFLVTLLLTWLYNRSGGSILASGLMHTSFIVVVRFLPPTPAWHLLLLGVALLALGGDRMWRPRPRPDRSGDLLAHVPATLAAPRGGVR